MILVTGGTGLVGSHLLFELAQKNKSIRAIYRSQASLQKVKEVFGYYCNNPNDFFDKIEWVLADITDVPTMISVFENVTEVYHIAALISFDPKDYIEMRKVNIHGTAIVVNLSIDVGVKKLCYVSSIATISQDSKKKMIDEENDWNGSEQNHGYAITKYGGEMEVWRASQEGVNVIVVNPGVILGPGFWHSGSGKLFSQVAKGFSYYTEGVTGFVGVNDVVKAMLQLMKSNVINERFILVSENKSYKEVLFEIAKELNVKEPNKRVSYFATTVFWRWEKLKTLFTRKRPKLTKLSAKSLHTISLYDNKKIKLTLNFMFEEINEVIKNVAAKF